VKGTVRNNMGGRKNCEMWEEESYARRIWGIRERKERVSERNMGRVSERSM
jgi:hypothetical protein